jgi:hypothetical protein
VKPRELKAGMFVYRAKNGYVREILFIGGPGATVAGRPAAGEVFYADDFGGSGRCGLSAMASWAAGAIARPAEWTRGRSMLVAQLQGEGKLPEQHGEAPKLTFSIERSNLAKAIIHNAIRNTILEDIHAGRTVRSKSGDFEDVKVVTPYGEIPWNEVSHISDEQMKDLMIKAVDTAYTMLSFPQVPFAGPPEWNDAKPDEETMLRLAYLGFLGEDAKREAVDAVAKMGEDPEATDEPGGDLPSP